MKGKLHKTKELNEEQTRYDTLRQQERQDTHTITYTLTRTHSHSRDNEYLEQQPARVTVRHPEKRDILTHAHTNTSTQTHSRDNARTARRHSEGHTEGWSDVGGGGGKQNWREVWKMGSWVYNTCASPHGRVHLSDWALNRGWSALTDLAGFWQLVGDLGVVRGRNTTHGEKKSPKGGGGENVGRDVNYLSNKHLKLHVSGKGEADQRWSVTTHKIAHNRWRQISVTGCWEHTKKSTLTRGNSKLQQKMLRGLQDKWSSGTGEKETGRRGAFGNRGGGMLGMGRGGGDMAMKGGGLGYGRPSFGRGARGRSTVEFGGGGRGGYGLGGTEPVSPPLEGGGLGYGGSFFNENRPSFGRGVRGNLRGGLTYPVHCYNYQGGRLYSHGCQGGRLYGHSFANWIFNWNQGVEFPSGSGLVFRREVTGAGDKFKVLAPGGGSPTAAFFFLHTKLRKIDGAK